MSDELMELPEGWAQATFGDICKVQGGYAFKSQDYQEHGVLLIRISNLVDEQVQLTSNSVFLPKHYWEKFLEFQLKEGDVLIAMSGATTGKMATYKLDSPALLNQRVGRFKIKDLTATTPSYVAKLVESITEQVLQQAYGGAQPNISPKEIEEFPVPLPPLNEQKRIVAAIESLRNRSQNARSALSAIPELCDKFRQSVLAAAFRGDLTADWREQNSDVEPASVLLERIRQKDSNTYKELQERDLPETWKWVKFQDVADIQSNLVDPASYLDSPHIAPNHIVSSTGELLEFTTVSADKVTSSKHLFEPGQIIYSKIRPYLAKAVLINFSGLCSADMYPIKSRINSAFLHQWMICPEFTELASGQQGRTVLPKINQAALNQLPVPVPPLAEQIEIIRQLQSNLSLIATITSQIEKTTYEIDFLDRSILAKAFRGELVEQDLNDEPASVLLERIRVDREQRAQEKTKRKRTVKTDSV